MRIAGTSVVVAAVLTFVLGCAGDSDRAGDESPPVPVLRELCQESFTIARAEFARSAEVVDIENALGVDPPAGGVTCQGDAWLLDVDGQEVRIELGVALNPVDDPGDPADDYCLTEGVEGAVPRTGYEPREFDGHPYCYTWNDRDYHYRASSSYIDNHTLIFIVWSISSGPEVHDPSTRLGSSFRAANDAVLAGIYKGLREAEDGATAGRRAE